TRLSTHHNGNNDLMQKIAIGQTTVNNKASNLRMDPVRSTTVTGIFLNPRVSPTNDVRVRQAINYAIDTKSIIQDILDGYGKQVSTWQSSLSFGNDPSLPPYPYDPNKARTLLAAAHLTGTPKLNFVIDGTD